jgi:DNA invertase Pin-like site-specific DNA recombinase
MLAFPRTTNRHRRYRSEACANMPPSVAGASQRELREILIAAARRREIDGVLVWRLDRWGRSVADLVSTLQELQHLDVGFVSLTEALDLTTPAGRAHGRSASAE